MLQALTEINNCYKLQALLSDTPLAEDWLASAIYSPHKFILKFYKQSALSGQAIECFRKEAMRYYGLSLKGFAKLIEVESYEGRVFVCTEYFGDDTLFNRLLKAGELDLVFSCDLVITCARSLERLHANGLAYVSLSPVTVFVGRGQLSAANVELQVPGSFSLLNDGEAAIYEYLGSSCFLAPEAQDRANLGKACDIYSLGAMLAWLITRLEPKVGQCRNAWLDAMRQKNIPSTILAVVSRALADSTNQRFGTCTDFIEAIDPWLEANQAKAPRPWTAEPVEYGLDRSRGEDRPVIRLPEAVPHPEVIKYFQELSSEYLSATLVVKTRQAVTPHSSDHIKPADIPVKAMTPGDIRLADTSAPAVIEEMPTLPIRDIVAASTLSASKDQVSAAKPDIEFEQPGETPALQSAMNWRYREMSMDGVMAVLRSSVQRARGALGDLRFIEEPDTRTALDQLDSLFASLSESALYVEVGSMLRFGTADVTDFLRAYRQALARALRNESKRSLLRFGRLAEQLGVRRHFEAYPLGTLFYGKDGEEMPVERVDYAAIIEAITVFGRRRRPLLLVVRGGECMNPSLTEFFVRMVPVVSTKPVCLFVFGEEFPAELNVESRKGDR